MNVKAGLVLIVASLSYAHEGHHHGAVLKGNFPEEKAQVIQGWYQQIEPMIRRSCFDCHSTEVKYPQYYKIPGAHWLIDRDIKDGRAHLDFTHGFPFGGHGTNEEDLKAIAAEVQEREMPPWRYWMIHKGTRLSDEEIKAIVDFTQKAQTELKQ